MSRLPRRLQTTQSSSPEPLPLSKENFITSRMANKRKLDDQDLEALDQPRKLPAIGSLNSVRPLAASRTALNEPTTTLTTSKPPSRLTRRDPPRLGTTARPRSMRATSAPPKHSGPASRPPMSRIPSGSGILRHQNQLSSIESLQEASAQRLACDMDAERAKLTKLAADDRALSRQLASAKELDLDKRRALVDAADELERMR
ncbi:hypothetical protein EDC04DRAFT_731173 [Pisolithus marmoratus]|nr:hypothetical protein EDC04DRAFT_731173 [Pisolithus marmoratus]